MVSSTKRFSTLIGVRTSGGGGRGGKGRDFCLEVAIDEKDVFPIKGWYKSLLENVSFSKISH